MAFKKLRRTSHQFVKAIFLLKKVRRRHLTLGTSMLIKLAKWHLFGSDERIYDSQGVTWTLNPPSFSILITIYNQTAKQLNRSINSARLQSGAEIEILIVDDGSTFSETKNFLKKLDLNPNEHLYRTSNSGVVAARNFLIKKAKGDFLLFFDPDDQLQGDYISSAVSVLTQDRTIEVLYPDVLINHMANGTKEVWNTGPFDIDVLLNHNTIPVSSIVSRKLISMLGGFSEAFHDGVEDWDLWVRAALSGAKARHLPKLGYEYSVAPISRTTIAANNSHLIKLRTLGTDAHFPFNLKGKVQVFLLVPFFPRIGGVEKYVRQVMSELRDRNLDVVLVVTETDAVGYFDGVEEMRALGHEVIRRIDFSNDDLFIAGINALATANCLAINFGSPWAFLNAGRFNSIFKTNICFVFNNEISLERALAFSNYFDEFWVAYAKLKNSFPQDLQPNVHTMYTGIVPGSRSRKIKESDGKFTVGFLGRLSPEKGPLEFLEVVKLAGTLNDIEFIMGGEGPLERQVVSQSKTLRNFKFVGHVQKPFEFLSNIDCLVISSLVEGIPLVAMEALSIGVPLVTRDVGGISELLSDERNGYIWDGPAEQALSLIIHIKNRPKSQKFRASLDPQFWQINADDLLARKILSLIDTA